MEKIDLHCILHYKLTQNLSFWDNMITRWVNIFVARPDDLGTRYHPETLLPHWFRALIHPFLPCVPQCFNTPIEEVEYGTTLFYLC